MCRFGADEGTFWRRRRGIVNGPADVTMIPSGGETFVLRAEPSGTPQNASMMSATFTALSLLWRRVVRRDRTWVLRVRRHADDPLGAVLHEEVLAPAEEAKQRVEELHRAIASGDLPWET